jgi:hypothetical protein
MIKTITVLCLVAAAVLVGCQNDESTVAPPTTNQNHSPNTPNTPSPANGATGVNVHVVFSWIGGDPDAGDTTRYDLFYGTNQNTGNLAVSNTLNTVFDFGLVGHNTVIYWRVVAKDNHGLSTDGPVWHFTTEQ